MIFFTGVAPSSHWYEKGDEASPSIILASQARLVKTLITLESCYVFASNFEYFFSFFFFSFFLSFFFFSFFFFFFFIFIFFTFFYLFIYSFCLFLN